MSTLPFELLEPIILEAVEPGTRSGANILLVCGLWHAIGRRRLYEKVDLRSQEAYDSYFIGGPHVATSWRADIQLQREDDYAQLRELTLSFAPLKKVPFSLSSFSPTTGNFYFPRLKTLHLSLASGSSYLLSRPKPLSRRVAKLLGDFSPKKRLTIAPTSSADITLAALSSVTLHATRVLELASHHISFLPLSYLRHSPLEHIVVRPYPAVRARDVHLLSSYLDARTTLHVRFCARAREEWYDREMRQEIEKAVWAAVNDHSPAGDWVDVVKLEFEGEEGAPPEEYDLEEAVARHPVYPEGAFM